MSLSRRGGEVGEQVVEVFIEEEAIGMEQPFEAGSSGGDPAAAATSGAPLAWVNRWRGAAGPISSTSRIAPLAPLVGQAEKSGGDWPASASRTVGDTTQKGDRGRGAVPGARRRPLTLEELGIGSQRAYRKLPMKKPPSNTAQRRLNTALRQALATRDRLRGIGAHGAVMAALRNAALNAGLPKAGEARMLVVLDGAGRVSLVDVLESNGARGPWITVAHRARSALKLKRLPVPRGASGLELEIRVVTRTQLPSGADPGLGVSIGGIPVKEGEGKRSGSIDVLKPHLRVGKFKLPGTDRDTELPTIEVGISVLGVNIDPADIGAEASRVVHSEVVRHRVL